MFGELLKLGGTKEELLQAQPDLGKRSRLSSLLSQISGKPKFWRFVSRSLDMGSDAEILDYISEFEKFQQYLSSPDIEKWDLDSLRVEIGFTKGLEALAENSVPDFAAEKRSLISSGMSPSDADLKARGVLVEKLVSEGKISSSDRDLFLKLLSREIRKFRGERAKDLSEKAKGESPAVNLDAMARSGSDIIFENENYLVVLPGTESASKYWGSGTRWCTAADSNNQFLNYSSHGVYLYYILDKLGDRKDVYSKVAISITKTNGVISPNPVVNLADDSRSSVDALRSGLRAGEDFAKIKSAIWSDAGGREETKWEEMIADLTPEDLKANLAGAGNAKGKVLYRLAHKIDKIKDAQTREIIASECSPDSYFEFGLYLNPEYKKFFASKAKRLDGVEFFGYELNKSPELKGAMTGAAYRELIEEMALDVDSVDFFALGLDSASGVSSVVTEQKQEDFDRFPWSSHDKLKQYEDDRFLQDKIYKYPAFKSFYSIPDDIYFEEKLFNDPKLKDKAAEKLERLEPSLFFAYYFEHGLSGIPGIQSILLNKASELSPFLFFKSGVYKILESEDIAPLENIIKTKASRLSDEEIRALKMEGVDFGEIPALDKLIDDFGWEAPPRAIRSRHMIEASHILNLSSALMKLGFSDLASRISKLA